MSKVGQVRGGDTAADTRTRTILICEDEELICWALEQHLSSLGYEVVSSDDGLSCVDRLAGRMPDLIILDLVMPNGGGLSVLEHLRAAPKRPPTLLLTAHAPTHGDVVAAKALGIDAYLTKPFSLEELAVVVRRLLS